MISLYRPMQQTDSSRLDLTHAWVNELTMAHYDEDGNKRISHLKQDLLTKGCEHGSRCRDAPNTRILIGFDTQQHVMKLKPCEPLLSSSLSSLSWLLESSQFSYVPPEVIGYVSRKHRFNSNLIQTTWNQKRLVMLSTQLLCYRYRRRYSPCHFYVEITVWSHRSLVMWHRK